MVFPSISERDTSVFENILPMKGTVGFHMNFLPPVNDSTMRMKIISSSEECTEYDVLLIKAGCLEDTTLNDMKCRAYFISVHVDRWWFWKTLLRVKSI
jgi:hypothetical protein